MSIDFLLTSLVVVLLPGTGVIYTLAIGLSRGFRASVAAALGCTLGIIPAALASIVGLAALLHTSAIAFQILKYSGVAYLFYMAWKTLRDTDAVDLSESAEKSGYGRIAVNATLLNVLNPKLSLFFLAFLPQFLSPEAADPAMSLALLASVFMAMTLLVFILYGALAAYARDYVVRRPSTMQWFRRCFAGTFGFLGAKLALSN
ncbi:LysE family translocator [Amaricoccus tamworthensis]|uniref:LysE family translocator n=1 Tax=Amaricoccus tamworthensis TaxID=57002 RepID=UPI003C7A0B07